MNKYLLPIYHSKLKPWIKYWLYKHTEKVPVPVLSDWTEGYSPIELSNAFPDTTLQDLSLIGNILQTGIPTPTNPVAVQTVSGSNTITLNNTSNYNINLKSKNLFDKTNPKVLNAYFTSSSSSSSLISNANNRTIYVECKPSTTYCIRRKKGDIFSSGYTDSLPEVGVTVNSITASPVNIDTDYYYEKVTTGENAKYIVSRITNVTSDTITLEEIYNSLQIEESETATTYEPYYNYEVCKIGDYEDKIYKENDKWYIEKNVGKYIIDIQAISSGSLGNGNKYSVVVPPNKKQDYQAGTLCNNAKYITVTTDPQDGEYYQNNPNFVFVGNSTDTLSTIQAKYNGGFLYYQLAEPTTTEITSDTTLYTQLEAIVTDMKLTSGNNKLSQTNADLPFYLLFKYYMKG